MPSESFRRALVAAAPALRRYARALTRDRDLADDLTQETLARALARAHLHRYGDLRVWLFAILTNLDRNRRRGLARSAEIVELAEHEIAGPAAEISRRDLDRGLSRLSPDQREALLLVALEGLSYADAAKVLDIPIGTLTSRLARAREELRAFLTGETSNPLRTMK